MLYLRPYHVFYLDFMAVIAPKRYTLTAALPYANGPVHIGHLAGVYVPADAYARFLRMSGADVIFVCGSDEHGVAITMKAKKEGLSLVETIDKYHNQIKQSFIDFGISFDIYSRTSSPIHHQTAQDFFTVLNDKNIFIKQETEQFFDEQEQQFLADRYIQGTCPKCGYEHAYGDQCESCGTTLSPTELINPRSMLSGNPPVLRPTSHWYLPLDRYENWLRNWILEQHTDWKPNVYGQCKSWIEQGLMPRAVTRDLNWGVKVPLPQAEGKVLYVWFDAPIGYISATKDFFEQHPDGNPHVRSGGWQPYWQAADTKLVHFIGKDNIVFHCIIFPTMLHAHGEYILPESVPANEFLNLEGSKISTSRNWAVWLHEYLQDFQGKQDSLRYALMSQAPETKDNDFTWKEFQARHNNELVAILGNFINRVFVLTHKFFDGLVPAAPLHYSETDHVLIQEMERLPQLMSASLEQYRFREALGFYMDLARAGNRYLTITEPWKLHKTDIEATASVLYLCLQLVGLLSIVGEPFLPHTSSKIRVWMGLENEQQLAWPKEYDALPIGGQKIAVPTLLFEKIEDEQIAAQMIRLQKPDAEIHAQNLETTAPVQDIQTGLDSSKNVILPIKQSVDFENFAGIDLRIATILSAEKIKKSDKLLKISLDIDGKTRNVVSGIAEHYTLEQLVGMQVCVVANLAPRRIKGIESEGMILMAENTELGKPVFIIPAYPTVSGSVIS